MDHATLNQYFESNGGLLDHQHEDVNKRAGPGVVEEVNIRQNHRHPLRQFMLAVRLLLT
jgi:hypothetical protein